MKAELLSGPFRGPRRPRSPEQSRSHMKSSTRSTTVAQTGFGKETDLYNFAVANSTAAPSCSIRLSPTAMRMVPTDYISYLFRSIAHGE